MGTPGIERVENKGFNVVERATVNVNPADTVEYLAKETIISEKLIPTRFPGESQFVESNAVQILRNKEIETEERIAKSPLHLSLRELSI